MIIETIFRPSQPSRRIRVHDLLTESDNCWRKSRATLRQKERESLFPWALNEVSRVSLLHLHFVCATAELWMPASVHFYAHTRTSPNCTLNNFHCIAFLSCHFGGGSAFPSAATECILCSLGAFCACRETLESSMSRPYLSFCSLQSHSWNYCFHFHWNGLSDLFEFYINH